jgi:hypothetical protein
MVQVMIGFKQFISETKASDAAEKWEDILHHIAEEELIACKVFEIKLVSSKDGKSTIKVTADCNDNKRSKGLQPDLSKKLTDRLLKHKLPGLGTITAKVYHLNVDPR